MVFFPDTCAAPTDRKRLTRKKRGTCLSRTAEETWLPAPTETAQIKDTQKIKRDPIISFILITDPRSLFFPGALLAVSCSVWPLIAPQTPVDAWTRGAFGVVALCSLLENVREQLVEQFGSIQDAGNAQSVASRLRNGWAKVAMYGVYMFYNVLYDFV